MTQSLPASFRLLALAALPILAPTSVLAAAAAASQPVNVRSGPATTYGIVDKLEAGEAVDVRQCEGSFCQVTYGGKSGWVSAAYLTRDYVPRAPATIEAARGATAPTTVTTTTTADLPPVSPGGPATPRVASAAPAAGASMPLPAGTFPPAYGDAADSATNADSYGGPGDGSGGDGYASSDSGYPGQPRSSVDLPDGSGDIIVSAGDGVPRPKADIPNGAFTGPTDEVTAGGGSSDFVTYADIGDLSSPAPSVDDRYGPGTGWRGRFAASGRFGWRGRVIDGPSGGQACFFSGHDFGGDGFCLRAGQTVAELGPWSDRIFMLRNPRGLLVTVCSAARECRVYDSSGPLVPGRAGFASISVAMPGY